MLCLVQEKCRRERHQREKEERSVVFLLFGKGEKEKRGTRLAWVPHSFSSPLISEET